MGYRSKLLVEHMGIELPLDLFKKYQDNYYFGQKDGKYFLNISSKEESKGHWSIIEDLTDFLKNDKGDYSIYAVVLWEDGAMDRVDLKSGKLEHFDSPEY